MYRENQNFIKRIEIYELCFKYFGNVDVLKFIAKIQFLTYLI